MVLIALGFAGFIVILGLWGFLAPRSIGVFVRSWSTMGGMWLAVALRASFAIVLWFAAPLSRTEMALKALAGLSGASAVVLPIIGLTRFQKLIDRFLELPNVLVRVWCIVAIVVGCFVFWSTMRPITIVVPENPIEYVN